MLKLGCCRIQTAERPPCVDPVIPGFDFESFAKPFKQSQEPEDIRVDFIRDDVNSAQCGSDAGNETSQSGSETAEVNEAEVNEDATPRQCQETEGDSVSTPTVLSSHASAASSLRESATDADGSGDVNAPPSADVIDEAAQQDEILRDLLEFYDVTKGLVEYEGRPLHELDNSTGVLRVWYLVLEGLAGMVAECPRHYQPQALEMLFELMRLAAKQPGEAAAVETAAG